MDSNYDLSQSSIGKTGWVGGFQPQAAMLQIMASFVMAIMTACALMWASGAMERRADGGVELNGWNQGWCFECMVYIGVDLC